MTANDWQLIINVAQVITAITAVAGVIVAALLGWRGLKLADRSVDRATKDHLSVRAMECSSSMTRVHRGVANIKGALHPYWKGDEFKKDMPRLTVIEQETRVHESKYLLDAELASLGTSLDGLSEIFDDADVTLSGGQSWTTQLELAKARMALIDLAFFPHYHSLIGEPDEWAVANPKEWLELQTLGPARKQRDRDPLQIALFHEWVSDHSFDDASDLANHSIMLLENMLEALNDQIIEMVGSVMRFALSDDVPSRPRRSVASERTAESRARQAALPAS